MTVKELKETISNIPDDTRVLVEVEGSHPIYEEAAEVWFSPLCNTLKFVSYEEGS